MTRLTGILGGTFDPVHNGHLRMALECYERLELAEVKLVPLYAPPHRDKPYASPEHRMAMLELAISDTQGLEIDDCELKRQEVSFTIDTVKYFRKQSVDGPLCLLMGTDAFHTLHTWHNWQQILDYVHIVIAERPGKREKPESKDLIRYIAEHGTDHVSDLRKLPAGKIYELVIPILDISSTQVRDIFKKKGDPKFLLPDTVIEYIHKNRVY